jgi:hypothetical protein
MADPSDVPWTEVDAGPSAFTSRRAAGADPPLELQNCFGSLEIEEAGDEQTMRGHLSLLRTQITRARRDGRLATPCRVGDLGGRARYET